MSSKNQFVKTHVSVRKHFSDPLRNALDGIVAVGAPVAVESLVEAYSFGIFPWPHEDYPMLWFCPDTRGILDFSDLHLPTSLLKWLKKTDLKTTINQNFREVMEACGKVPRPNQSGTWITPEMKKAYLELHKMGLAHSVEVWDGSKLVGGIYGVYVGGTFSAESMFYHVSNASKLAFLTMVHQLEHMGCEWMDIQMLTPVTEHFGGKYIPKKSFLARLVARQKENYLPFITAKVAEDPTER